MKKFGFVLFVLIAMCMSSNAQKFYYEGGYFEKNGEKWFEYKPTEKDGVWNQFTEVDNQENFYVIDNGLCQVAVPKSTSYNFLIKLKGQSEWQFKYTSKKAEQPTQTSSIHSRLVALVAQQNEYTKGSTESNGITILPTEIGSESEKIITLNFEIKDYKYNYSDLQLKTTKKLMRKAAIKILKEQKSDEMIRLMIEGNYTLRYKYFDRRGKIMYEFDIKAKDLN